MIAVLGGGLCGLAAGLMLARDGHDVTVLERDEAPVPGNPEAAWAWRRPGVAQFNQAHYLQPLGRAVLEAELPDVLAAFVADGAVPDTRAGAAAAGHRRPRAAAGRRALRGVHGAPLDAGAGAGPRGGGAGAARPCGAACPRSGSRSPAGA